MSIPRPTDALPANPPPAASRRPWLLSLRWRLLAATLVALTLALLLAGVFLAGLFRDHVLRQFAASLTAQLDQITARLDFDAAGQPVLDPQTLSDPRWTRPYSGLYWQVDAMGASPRRAVMRSRSLWDSQLAVDDDALADGAVHRHEIRGPDGARLLVVERTVRQDTLAAARWPDSREAVLLVGHQPALGQLAAHLIGGPSSLESAPWTVRKGAVWWLRHRVRDGEASVVLVAVHTPELL